MRVEDLDALAREAAGEAESQALLRKRYPRRSWEVRTARAAFETTVTPEVVLVLTRIVQSTKTVVGVMNADTDEPHYSVAWDDLSDALAAFDLLAGGPVQ